MSCSWLEYKSKAVKEWHGWRIAAGGQSFSRRSCLETRTGGREHNVITDGSLSPMWKRICSLFSPWYTNEVSKWVVMWTLLAFSAKSLWATFLASRTSRWMFLLSFHTEDTSLGLGVRQYLERFSCHWCCCFLFLVCWMWICPARNLAVQYKCYSSILTISSLWKFL